MIHSFSFDLQTHLLNFDVIIQENSRSYAIDLHPSHLPRDSILLLKIKQVVANHLSYDTITDNTHRDLHKRNGLALMQTRLKRMINHSKEIQADSQLLRLSCKLYMLLKPQRKREEIFKRTDSLLLEVLRTLRPLALQHMAKTFPQWKTPINKVLEEYAFTLSNRRITDINFIDSFFNELATRYELVSLQKAEDLCFQYHLTQQACPPIPHPLSYKSHGTRLHQAIRDGSISGIKAILQQTPKEALDVCDEYGNTPLYLAIKHAIFCGNDIHRSHTFAQIIDELIKGGANVNMVDTRYGRPSPLYLAVLSGNVTILNKLLKAGANASLYYLPSKQSPLHLALQKAFHARSYSSIKKNKIDYYSIIKSLLDYQANIYAPDLSSGIAKYPLYEVALHGKSKLFFLFLEHQKQFNRKKATCMDEFGHSIPASSLASYGPGIKNLVELLFFNKRWKILNTCIWRGDLPRFQIQKLAKTYPYTAKQKDGKGHKLFCCNSLDVASLHNSELS